MPRAHLTTLRRWGRPLTTFDVAACKGGRVLLAKADQTGNRFTSAGLVGSDENPARANNCSLVNIPGRTDTSADWPDRPPGNTTAAANASTCSRTRPGQPSPA